MLIKITKSMQQAIDITNKRREVQISFNKKHNIKIKSITKPLVDILDKEIKIKTDKSDSSIKQCLSAKEISDLIKKLEKKMYAFAKDLKFELAADVRNEIIKLKNEFIKS